MKDINNNNNNILFNLLLNKYIQNYPKNYAEKIAEIAEIKNSKEFASLDANSQQNLFCKLMAMKV